MANNVRPSILDRLAGLETEYAIRFRPAPANGDRPTKLQLYRSLVESLRRRVLVAEAKHFKEGVFTACGGAVWFEAEKPAAGGGLIEGATPECRGPRQLVTYQRAQDRLLGEAAKSASVGGDFALIKNDRDSENNVYGAQENYEATVASGWRLVAWRASLAMLAPLMVLTWLGLALLIVGVLIYLAIAGLLYLPLHLVVPRPRRVALLLFGRDLVEGCETGGPAPVWLEAVLLALTRIVTGPLALTLWGMAELFAFHSTRRQMLPFLISRPIFAGSGMLDRQGEFWIADKAPAMNTALGFGGFIRERPIFTIGHFFKTLCAEACFSLGDYAELFRARQRLQIALGDSNMSEQAEFLRVGTTMLVLDAIEAGYLTGLPRVRRPIRSLHAVAADPSLQTQLPFADGQRLSALEVQRLYWNACRRFVESQPQPPAEAFEVLERWEAVLDDLDEMKRTGIAPEQLLGVVDWVTKRYLLEKAGKNLSWESRKKIDIRYHELSPDGYYFQLQQAGVGEPLISDDEIGRAMRSPPPDSPATARGHYIREFSQDCERFAVNWKRVIFSDESVTRTIRLSRYQRRAASADTPPSCDSAPNESPSPD